MWLSRLRFRVRNVVMPPKIPGEGCGYPALEDSAWVVWLSHLRSWVNSMVMPPKIQGNSNWWLLLRDSNLFLRFQNNFTAEFWATFSYRLLLRRFFWDFSGIIYYINKRKNISKFFYQTQFSLNSRVLLSANFSININHQWNRHISHYYRMTSVVLCKVLQPSR